MNHDKYRELIELSGMDELNTSDMELLKQHLSICKECASFYEEEKKFKELLICGKTTEPSDELLKEARLELRAALRLERSKQNRLQNFFEPVKDFFGLQYKTVLNSAAFLFAGIAVGYFAFIIFGQEASFENATELDDFALLKSGIQINNMRIVKDSEKSGEIEFTFDAVKQVRLSGSMDDERIQKLITYSILNEKNPGVRLNSISLISDKAVRKVDNDIKIALETAAKYDENPGVRREALLKLKDFPFDGTIKQTYLHVLMNDENSGLRIEAINGLIEANKQGHSFDNEMIETLKAKSTNDENNYIQIKARTILGEVY